MTRVPDLEQAMRDGIAWSAIREQTRDKIQSGTPMEYLAETFIQRAMDCLATGDTAAADSVLFHAVHIGIPPHLFITEHKKKVEEEVRTR